MSILLKRLFENEDKFFPIDKIGRWWDKNEEIDLVAFNENEDKILFGEVKWSNKPVGTNIYNDLKRKAKLVKWGTEKRREYFCLFQRVVLTDEMKKVSKKGKHSSFEEDRLLI